MTELGPSWEDKRNLVRYLIEDSNISPISKNYLKDCEDWIPRYQYRGFKYGLGSMVFVYAFFPVTRRLVTRPRWKCSMSKFKSFRIMIR